jgi:CheY-like chemotaxis protein
VLVVEDNLVNQRVATKMLKSLGCCVSVRTIHQTKGVALWPVPAKAPELTLHSMPFTMCVAGG